MRLLLLTTLLGAAISPLLTSCSKIPGKPVEAEKWIRPENLVDFEKLYPENCGACHAIKPNTVAAARPLNDPLYVAFVGKENIIKIITEGVHGTSMPALSAAKGGYLTPKQIEVLADGVIKAAGSPVGAPSPLPPYSAPAGNPATGQQTYATYCASCHGADGTGTGKIGSIVDPNYLALVSDQSPRSMVIAGRPDISKHNFATYLPDRVMTSEEAADIVAWLVSHRVAQ